MLSTSVVYADQWLTFRRDEIERGDGSRGTYAYVQKRSFALIIAAENGGFHLVEEYRYPLGRRGWSFPQGGFPHDESGTAEELARLELAQETGLRAARLTHLGTIAATCGPAAIPASAQTAAPWSRRKPASIARSRPAASAASG